MNFGSDSGKVKGNIVTHNHPSGAAAFSVADIKSTGNLGGVGIRATTKGNGTARRYPGNYTNFIARKKENYDKQMKDHIAQQKEIERLQRMVTRFKGKPTKTSMAQSKQKAIDRMVIIEAPDKYDNKTFHANFQPEKETGNDVLYTSELAIGYDHPLSVVSLDLKRGEKLGILGGNGLGKSTFLKTIVGKIPALSGEY